MNENRLTNERTNKTYQMEIERHVSVALMHFARKVFLKNVYGRFGHDLNLIENHMISNQEPAIKNKGMAF